MKQKTNFKLLDLPDNILAEPFKNLEEHLCCREKSCTESFETWGNLVLHESLEWHCPMCGISNGDPYSKENEERLCIDCEEERLKGA